MLSRWIRTAGSAVAAALAASVTVAVPALAAPAAVPAAVTDQIVFGEAGSEAAHAFDGPRTQVVDGAVGQKARVSLATEPPSFVGGNLTFTLKVDPDLQNYFTVKMWGSDAQKGKTQLYVDGAMVGQIHLTDTIALSQGGAASLNRFFYSTQPIPLARSKGRTSLTLSIVSRAEFAGYQLGTREKFYDKKFTDPSRGYYRAYSSLTSQLPAALTDGEPQNTGLQPGQYPGDELNPDNPQAGPFTAAVRADYDKRIADLLATGPQWSGDAPRAQQLASALRTDLGVNGYAIETDPALRARVLVKIREMLDQLVRTYLNKPGNLVKGLYQGEWGGSYKAAGEALWIVHQLFEDQATGKGLYGPLKAAGWEGRTFADWLQGDEVVDWSTVPAGPPGSGFPPGGPTFFTLNGLAGKQTTTTTRREGYQELFFMGYTYARTHGSNITNQVQFQMYGAFAQNLGLLAIGSQLAESYASSLRQLYASSGITPWLGVDTPPSGSLVELDNGNVGPRLVVKGLAAFAAQFDGARAYTGANPAPNGRGYFMITPAGLTREPLYAAIYGEASNDLVGVWRLTWNDKLLQKALVTAHAKSYLRYQDVDGQNRRTMRIEGWTESRGPEFPGRETYATALDRSATLIYAGVERLMKQRQAADPTRYTGPEWDLTWRYAADAVGYGQQQLVDNRFLSKYLSGQKESDVNLIADYTYLSHHPLVPALLPMTNVDWLSPAQQAAYTAARLDRQALEHQAFVDVDDMQVAIRDGSTTIFATFESRANLGVNNLARVHLETPTYATVATVGTQTSFTPSGQYNTRPDWTNVDFVYDKDTQSPDGAHLATAGEKLPIAQQPFDDPAAPRQIIPTTGGGPFVGHGQFVQLQFGKFLMAINTTSTANGDATAYQVVVPGAPATVRDLVSGGDLRTSGGAVAVPAGKAVVLALGGDAPVNTVPEAPRYAGAAGAGSTVTVAWDHAGGVSGHYQVQRSTQRDTGYATVAGNVDRNATTWTDTAAVPGTAYFYRVVGVNAAGVAGNPSPYAAVTPARTAPQHAAYAVAGQDGKEPTLTVAGPPDGSVVAFGGKGSPVAPVLTGKPETLDAKFPADPAKTQLHTLPDYTVAYRTAPGPNFTFTTQVTPTGVLGTAGVVMKDAIATEARGLQFFVDRTGRYYLYYKQYPSIIPIYDMTADGYAVYDNAMPAPLTGTVAAKNPAGRYQLRITRTGPSVEAFVSADGRTWQSVGTIGLPMTDALLVGVQASAPAVFTGTSLSAP